METATKKIYTYNNDFSEYVKDINTGKTLLINSEMMYYWLEVLPPVYMKEIQSVRIKGCDYNRKLACLFGFAEGRELITDFWHAGNGNYWACKSNRLNKN